MIISTGASIHVLENIVCYCVQVTTTEENEEGIKENNSSPYIRVQCECWSA